MHFNTILSIIAIYALSIPKTAVGKAINNIQNQEYVGNNSWNLVEALKASSQLRSFNGTWIADKEFYYTAVDGSIRIFDAALNTDSVFVTSNFLNIYKNSSSFTLSPDNNRILVRYDVEEIFRHSFRAKYAIFDIATGKSVQIHNGEKLQYCGWSPINDRLAYVYDNNVYIHFTENLEVQITSDGINGIVYNGIPDWVYEEEVLSSGSAMWWSDDGNFLALGVFNDTNVETFKYFLYTDSGYIAYQYPKEVDLKYPKAGTKNPEVALKVFNLSNNTNSKVTNVIIRAPIDIVTEDHILRNVAWTNDGKLLIIWLNRRQNIASLQLCTITGNCREVKRFEEPQGWIDIGKPLCLKTLQNCVFTFWIDNWYQIWNLNLETGENTWQSRGNFTVSKLYGYDEINNKVYYQATLKNNPAAYHVFSNSECLTCNLTDEDGTACLSAAASFSKNYSYYVISCTGPMPSFTKIFATTHNTEIKDWESNTQFRKMLQSKLLPTVQVREVPLAAGSIGMAKLLFPPNLDRNKKYSMIVNVYGGPNSIRVLNTFGVGFETYMTTTRDVIYVQIDGRGTGNKGKDLLFSVNNHLGEFEVEDQIFVVKYLQKQYPFVDKDRCGIWGWSYGGYITARTLANDTDRVFKCGISVAPVTSWLYYDSIYTERYMGLPQENSNKYVDTSVLQNVSNFRNHKFMLIHGTGDDNVHYQNTLMLSKELQKNDILFEEMTYPDENHSIRNLAHHLYMTMNSFWSDCLNLVA